MESEYMEELKEVFYDSSSLTTFLKLTASKLTAYLEENTPPVTQCGNGSLKMVCLQWTTVIPWFV
jgi:hypothetical protein